MNILQLVQNCQVEWKALGEVCEFRNGFAFKSNLFKDIGIPLIRITNVNGGLIDLSDVKYCNPEDYNVNLKSYEINKGDILIAMSGATTGKIGFYNHDQTSFLNQRVGKFIPNQSKLNNRYLYHFLLSRMKELYILAGGGAQPNLSSNKIMNEVKIPIPPLEIQEKIVQILDNFTELTAELKAELAAELTARQKQYQHYRDFLLDCDNPKNPFLKGLKVEWRSLGEIVPLQRGKRLIKSQLNENGQFAVFQNSLQPLGYYDEANCRAYMTFIISAGAAGVIGFSHKSFWAADDCYYFDCPKDLLNDRFLYYFLLTQKHKLTSQVRKASVPRLGKNVIEKIKIPIPPLETQAQIVAILDKFDTLTHSISEGLPREIELRQKQHEYYRELLLDFT